MGKKITQLATITEVADDDLIVGVDVSDTSGSDNGTNKKFTKANFLKEVIAKFLDYATLVGEETIENKIIENSTIDGGVNTITDIYPSSISGGLDGWTPALETWVYNSVNSFKISGDYRTVYQVGDKLKLTQTTDKYFRITAISYSSPDTTVTVESFGLYSLANATITSPCFSRIETPFGFPLREKVLFSGTPSGSVTLSESSAYFNRLIVYIDGNNVGGVDGTPRYSTVLDMGVGKSRVTLSDMGYIDSTYLARTGSAVVSASGTTLTISGSGANYSISTTAGNVTTFSDVKIVPKIRKVIGIRW